MYCTCVLTYILYKYQWLSNYTMCNVMYGYCTYVHTCVTYSVFLLSLLRYRDSKAEEQRPILNVSQLNYASAAIVTLIILMAGIESGRNIDTSSTHLQQCKQNGHVPHATETEEKVSCMWCLKVRSRYSLSDQIKLA